MNMLASRGQLRASFLRWALFTVPLCVLLGFLSGQLGSPDTAWFQSLVKPGIYPEPKWFGIVWTILYVMIGFALALVASAWGARGRTAAFLGAAGCALVAAVLALVLLRGAATRGTPTRTGLGIG